MDGTVDSAIPMTVSADFEAALADAGYNVQLTTFDGGHDLPPADIGLEIYEEVLGKSTPPPTAPGQEWPGMSRDLVTASDADAQPLLGSAGPRLNR